MSLGWPDFFSPQDLEKTLAEVWAEKHQDHVVFKKGAKVRVAYEHLMHKLRHGQQGEVIGYADGEVCVKLQQALVPIVMPAQILVSYTKPARFLPLKTFLRTPHKAKEDMLRVLGVSDPSAELIEILTPKQQRLSDKELDYFGHCCLWALGLDEERDVQFAPCALVELLLDGFEEVEGSMGAEDPEAHEKRMRVFKWMAQRSKILLVPIRSSLKVEHFTLLVIRKDDEHRVRYFDSLCQMHEGCLLRARLVLALLDIDVEIHRQFNEFRQEGVECGFVVCHYLEDEMRSYSGGQGLVGWPDEQRFQALRNYIMKVSSALEAHRQKWAAQWLEDEKKAEKEEQVQAKMVVRMLQERGLLEAAISRNEELGKQLVNQGANEEPPVLPEGFGVRVRVSKKKLEEQMSEVSKKTGAG